MEINNNIETIYVFAIIFLNDIFQQINNAKFIRYNAKINYRTYFYFKKKRGNLKYDIAINNKYYKKFLQQRQ